MKQPRTLVATSLYILVVSVPAQSIQWVKHYGSANVYVSGFKLATAPDGSIYGTGSIEDGAIDFDGNASPVLGDRDIIVAKWDSSGINQWVRTIGGIPVQDDWDRGEFIQYEPFADRLIVNGTYSNQADFGPDQFDEADDHRSIFLASYHPDGTCEWVRAVRSAAIFNTYLITDDSGDCYWFGNSFLGSPQFLGFPSVIVPSGGFVARYDDSGELRSARRILKYGNVAGAAWVDSTHWLLSIGALEGEELFGVDLGVTAVASGVLALVDTSGAVLWFHRHQGTEGYANGSAGCAVIGSHAIFWGAFGGEMTFDGQVLNSSPAWSTSYLASYGLDGEPEWIRPFWTNGSCGLSLKLAVDNASTIYVAGDFTDTTQIGSMEAIPNGEASSFLARFDTLGNCLSALYYGPSMGSLGSVALSGDAIVLSAPYTGNIPFGPAVLPATNSVLLAKLDTLTGYTGVGPAFMSLQEELLIRANPNNGLCTVQLPAHLRFTNDLVLSIFDQTGRLVQRVPVTMGHAGVEVDIQAQAKGIYQVELGDGRQRYTGRIVFE